MLTGKSEIDRSSVTGLVVWLTIQLAALGMCAARMTFWARAPKATEQLALIVMLAVQIGTSALIFPHLLGTARATLLAVASGWPMALLAAEMSDASWTVLIRSETYVSIWLISLHLWTPALPTQGAKLLATTIAATISLGGPVLWYLQMEFSKGGQQPELDSFPAFGPLSGAISQTFARFNFESWIQLTIIFCVGATAFMGASRNRRSSEFSRQVIH
jgi:hypothetical protein